jgi:hypothetical protein
MTVEYGEMMLGLGCARQSFEVKDGRSKFVPAADCPEESSRADKLGTIPALFRLARDRLGSGMNDEVSISFDRVLGYPLSFYSGSREGEDAYFAFDVVRLESQDERRP